MGKKYATLAGAHDFILLAKNVKDNPSKYDPKTVVNWTMIWDTWAAYCKLHKREPEFATDIQFSKAIAKAPVQP